MTEAIGVKIRRLRLAAGLTLQQLAEKTGRTHVFLWRIERGERFPGDETLIAIARVLEVDAGELDRAPRTRAGRGAA